MYTYIMERTQIYLTARESAALDAVARRTGHTRSHLIREAIEAVYLAELDREERRRALDASAGAWSGRRETGEQTVERMRSGRLGRLVPARHADAAPDALNVAIVVVDTSVLIDHLRGNPDAIQCLRAAVDRGDELWSLAVVRTEVLAGARASEMDATRALLDSLRWLDVTVELADEAGAIAAQYVRSHPGVDTVDHLLAAATLRLEATLLTRNVRHFPMVEGLRPAY